MESERTSEYAEDTFAKYRQDNEGKYSADKLSHYFNNELGVAVNMLSTLSRRLKALDETLENEAIVVSVDSIKNRLVVVHEVGNVILDELTRREFS